MLPLLAQHQAYTTSYALSYMSSSPVAPSWDQSGLVSAMSNLSMQQTSSFGGWVMDSGTTSHTASDDDILPSSYRVNYPSRVTIGNGSSVPILRAGHTSLCTPYTYFPLRHVLVIPSLVKDLISVRQFTHDNSCSIEFDSFGFHYQ